MKEIPPVFPWLAGGDWPEYEEKAGGGEQGQAHGRHQADSEGQCQAPDIEDSVTGIIRLVTSNISESGINSLYENYAIDINPTKQ